MRDAQTQASIHEYNGINISRTLHYVITLSPRPIYVHCAVDLRTNTRSVQRAVMADDPADEEEGFVSSRYRWDVFLSFRGADTRKGFTDRLYNKLWLEGVRTFRDDEGLERGDEVAPGLLEAIQDSAAAIAVISERYAESRWCLEELATIADGRKLLLPVFYGVDPSDVRRQRGPFKAGFERLVESCGAEKVQRWRDAMEKAGNISGWDSKVW